MNAMRFCLVCEKDVRATTCPHCNSGTFPRDDPQVRTFLGELKSDSRERSFAKAIFVALLAVGVPIGAVFTLSMIAFFGGSTGSRTSSWLGAVEYLGWALGGVAAYWVAKAWVKRRHGTIPEQRYCTVCDTETAEHTCTCGARTYAMDGQVVRQHLTDG